MVIVMERDINQFIKRMEEAIEVYINHRLLPTDYFYRGILVAVMSNDLATAMFKASATELLALPEICRKIYRKAPRECFGSTEKFETWLRYYWS